MFELADPLALANALALGLYDHARTEPYEWGGGMDALTQRIASRAGGHVIGTSVRHGLAAVLGRSTNIEPCRGCASTEDRVAHAIVETFTDRDLATGRRVISEPYLAGTFAGAIAPTLWHPDGNLGDGLKAGRGRYCSPPPGACCSRCWSRWCRRNNKSSRAAPPGLKPGARNAISPVFARSSQNGASTARLSWPRTPWFHSSRTPIRPCAPAPDVPSR